jgi:hypothetical protein
VILSNIYDEPASATLCYSIGGKEQTPETWRDTGKPQPQPHPVLSAISVFDADCAAVHLKGKNEVAFRPFGLDVPDELGDACKQVKSVLEADKKQHEKARNAVFTTPPWKSTTAVGKSGSHLTLRWREQDSNPRSPARGKLSRDCPPPHLPSATTDL